MRYPLLVPVAVGALLAACAKAPTEPSSISSATASASTVIAAAPHSKPANRTSLAAEQDQTQLYQRASLAEREGRIVSPAGDNAFELLLTLREANPDHSAYRNALFDLMPLADRAIRNALQQNDLAEAERLTALVSRFDASSNVSLSARERLAEASAKASKAAALAAVKAVEASESVRSPAPPPATPIPAPTATPAFAAKASDATPSSAVAGTKPAMQSAVVAAAQASLTPAASGAPTGAGLGSVPSTQTAATKANQSETSRRSESALTAPVALRRAAVQYPEQAKRQGIEGFVELDVLIDTTGNPTDIKVLRSEPAGLFDRAAIRAMMRWKFQPAMRNGQAVSARTRTVMQFKKS